MTVRREIAELRRETSARKPMDWAPPGMAVLTRFFYLSGRVTEIQPTYTYNWLGLQQDTVAATQVLPTGNATIRFEFAYEGGRLGKGGIGTIIVNGQKVAEERIERTQCCFFSADEGADVDVDEGTSVTEAYTVLAKFTGAIQKATFELKDMKAANTEIDEHAAREAQGRKSLAH